MMRLILASLGLATVTAVALVLILGREGTPRAGAPEPPLPPAPAPAFVVSAPRPLVEEHPTARWSPILRSVALRSRPSSTAPVRETLDPRTPEGTQNLVLVRSRTVGADGRLWISVAGPGRPGQGAGWVPRRALGRYHPVTTRLVVDRAAFTATLYRGGRVVARFPVGVGVASSPTPSGHFYVRNRLTRYRNAFYGPVAFGTSVRSPYLTDWPDGGFVGIHGTDRPDLLPGRVSHGCIRLRNEDVLRLARVMPVGTPITIR
ncbi:MAG TPA: L,D-transpeptidase [Gaiella sp.]|jgi:hypothetical protein